MDAGQVCFFKFFKIKFSSPLPIERSVANPFFVVVVVVFGTRILFKESIMAHGHLTGYT